jgi:hypothetical protein
VLNEEEIDTNERRSDHNMKMKLNKKWIFLPFFFLDTHHLSSSNGFLLVQLKDLWKSSTYFPVRLLFSSPLFLFFFESFLFLWK